jgi:hypothetical protein
MVGGELGGDEAQEAAALRRTEGGVALQDQPGQGDAGGLAAP